MRPGEFKRFIDSLIPNNSQDRVVFVFGWIILSLPFLDQIFFEPFGILTVIFSVLYTAWMVLGVVLFMKSMQYVRKER